MHNQTDIENESYHIVFKGLMSITRGWRRACIDTPNAILKPEIWTKPNHTGAFRPGPGRIVSHAFRNQPLAKDQEQNDE
jgi:hypothetical protein